jgi:DNA-binding NtrC family response regulator
MAAYVLIVDDDPAERRHVEEIVRSQGHLTECADGGDAALARLTRADAPAISAVILDLVMPDTDGMAVLERLSRHSLTVPVVVQAAAGAADAGVAAMRAGAFDFLLKPASPERIRASLTNALRIAALESEILRMRLRRGGTLDLRDIFARSTAMERTHRLAERAARCAVPVLIEGERGAGKELLARAIHGSSARRNRAFVTVNCSGAESDIALFGADGCGGKLAEARGGTLFLNEIGTLRRPAQEALARFLAEGDGAARDGRPASRDVRIVATSSRRLVDLVREEEFLEELFHRLNVLPIWLPPLRDRRSDIPALVRSLLARLATEAGRPMVTAITSDAMRLLANDRWPGNIRELEHVMFRAIMLCDGPEITPHNFPSISARTGSVSSTVRGEKVNEIADLDTAFGVAVEEQVGDEQTLPPLGVNDTTSTTRYGIARLLDDRGELRPIEALEQEVIRFALGHYGGRMSEVARRLGIGRSTLYRKLRDYGMAADDPVTP